MGNWTGWKAVVGAIVIMSLIGFRVFNSTRTSGPQTKSDSWTIPARQATSAEIVGPAKLQFEITRTTPGKFHVYILDAQSHARLQSGALIDPATVKLLFDREGAGTITGQDITLAAGSYYLYAENTEDAPFTVNLRLTATR